jgi:hypothetical protein
MDIRQTLRVYVEERYRILYMTAVLFKVAAWIVLAAGVVFSGWLASLALIDITAPWASFLDKIASFFLAGIRFVAGVGVSIVPFVLIHSIGEYLLIQIAVEENTRYLTYLIQTRLKPLQLPIETHVVSNPPEIEQTQTGN